MANVSSVKNSKKVVSKNNVSSSKPIKSIKKGVGIKAKSLPVSLKKISMFSLKNNKLSSGSKSSKILKMRKFRRLRNSLTLKRRTYKFLKGLTKGYVSYNSLSYKLKNLKFQKRT